MFDLVAMITELLLELMCGMLVDRDIWKFTFGFLVSVLALYLVVIICVS